MSRKPVKRGDRNKAWRSSVRQGSPRYRTVQMTRHLVVTEGTETEPRYFNGMRLLLGEANGRKVNVVVRSTGKHTMGLLEYAKEACRRSPDVYDHVWLVYDKDDFSDENSQAGCTNASNGGINPADSTPRASSNAANQAGSSYFPLPHAITVDEQLSQMERRGLVVEDRDFAISKLQDLSYYRLCD